MYLKICNLHTYTIYTYYIIHINLQPTSPSHEKSFDEIFYIILTKNERKLNSLMFLQPLKCIDLKSLICK